MNRLKEILTQIDQIKQPPVEKWQPDNVGEIDIKIDNQGLWFHEGGSIQRFELVKLFASILWHENNQHYLVTPAEKLAIVVDDVPFIVQQMEQVEGLWVATTNTQDQVIVSEEHPVEVRMFAEQPVPYIRVRYDLWARVNRSIFYQWVSDAMDQEGYSDEAPLLLSSGSYTFNLNP